MGVPSFSHPQVQCRAAIFLVKRVFRSVSPLRRSHFKFYPLNPPAATGVYSGLSRGRRDISTPTTHNTAKVTLIVGLRHVYFALHISRCISARALHGGSPRMTTCYRYFSHENMDGDEICSRLGIFFGRFLWAATWVYFAYPPFSRVQQVSFLMQYYDPATHLQQ